METTDRAYFWKIRCINRQTKEMFDRHMVFRPGRASDGQQLAEALAILGSKQRHGDLPKLRGMFEEITLEQMHQICEHQRFKEINFVSPHHEYFEDEGGRQLDSIGVVAIQSGQENPIIVGDVRTVLRLGDSGMRNPASWGVNASNDVAHFLQVIAVLQRSRWMNAKLSLEMSGKLSPKLETPDTDSTCAALALIRQFLPGRDDIFEKAIELYTSQVDSAEKRWWIECELQQFRAHLVMIERLPYAPELSGITNADLLEAFIYGTGLIHRESNKRMEATLSQLVHACPRENLVFAFQMSCRQLLNPAINAACLVYRDFSHWTNSGMCPRPTRVVLSHLFGSPHPRSGG